MKLPSEIKVVSSKEAETALFSICLPASWAHCAYLQSHEYGRCSKCDCAVMFPPYMPKGPKKLCIRCFAIELEENREVNQPTIDSLKTFIKAEDDKAAQFRKTISISLSLRK
jgi:hypothetical protein